MNHLDSETLVLVALSETDLSQGQREHLAGCAACTSELRALRRTVATGRSAHTVDLVAPGEQLWAKIHRTLGLSQAVAAPPRLGEFGSPGQAPTAPATVTDTPHARRLRSWLPLTAAAAVAGLVGGVAVGMLWPSSRAPAAVPVVATATLEPLSGWEASGSAWVEEAADGHREVIVHLATVGRAILLREVWLTTADDSGLVSVGFLDGVTGRFTIPHGIDLAAYPLVEVSAEFDDGDPAHSGDAIVRGELNQGVSPNS